MAELKHDHEQEPEEIKKNKILLTAEEFQVLEDKAAKSDEYFDRLSIFVNARRCARAIS